MFSNAFLDGVKIDALTDADLRRRIAEMRILMDRFTLAPPLGGLLDEALQALGVFEGEAQRRMRRAS